MNCKIGFFNKPRTRLWNTSCNPYRMKPVMMTFPEHLKCQRRLLLKLFKWHLDASQGRKDDCRPLLLSVGCWQTISSFRKHVQLNIRYTPNLLSVNSKHATVVLRHVSQGKWLGEISLRMSQFYWMVIIMITVFDDVLNSTMKWSKGTS